MKDFLNFENVNYDDFWNEIIAINRIFDRLLFYDCGDKNETLLDDLRYLRMLFYYFIEPQKDKLSFDNDLKQSFTNSVSNTINALRASDETDKYLSTDLQELLLMENLVLEAFE